MPDTRPILSQLVLFEGDTCFHVSFTRAATVRKSSHPMRLDIRFAHIRKPTKTVGSIANAMARPIIISFE